MRLQAVALATFLVLALLPPEIDAADQSAATTERPKKEKGAKKPKPDPCIDNAALPETVKKAIEECKNEADAENVPAPTSTPPPSSRRRRSEGSEVKPVTDASRPVGDEELAIPSPKPEAETEAPKTRRKRDAGRRQPTATHSLIDAKNKEKITIVGDDRPNSDNELPIPPSTDDETKPEAGKRKRRDDEKKEDKKEDQKAAEKNETDRQKKEEANKERLKYDKFSFCLWKKLDMIDETTKNVKEEGVKAIIDQLTIDEEKKTILKDALTNCVTNTTEASKDKSKHFYKVMHCIRKSVEKTCPDARKWNFGREVKPSKEQREKEMLERKEKLEKEKQERKAKQEKEKQERKEKQEKEKQERKEKQEKEKQEKKARKEKEKQEKEERKKKKEEKNQKTATTVSPDA